MLGGGELGRMEGQEVWEHHWPLPGAAPKPSKATRPPKPQTDKQAKALGLLPTLTPPTACPVASALLRYPATEQLPTHSPPSHLLPTGVTTGL